MQFFTSCVLAVHGDCCHTTCPDGRLLIITFVGGDVPAPGSTIVERTFAWLGRCRRLSKDYEYLTETSVAMIHVAMIGLMVRRLTQ